MPVQKYLNSVDLASKVIFKAWKDLILKYLLVHLISQNSNENYSKDYVIFLISQSLVGHDCDHAYICDV